MIYSLYRVSFEFNNRTKAFDRYFMAASESDARKWFLQLVYKEIKIESPLCDQIVIPTDYNSVTVNFKKETCMKAELHYLPSKLKKISDKAFKNVQFEDIIEKFSKEFLVKTKKLSDDSF